jgi:hypothetical protein
MPGKYWIFTLVPFIVLVGVLWAAGAPAIQWVLALGFCSAAWVYVARVADGRVRESSVQGSSGLGRGLATIAALLDFSFWARFAPPSAKAGRGELADQIAQVNQVLDDLRGRSVAPDRWGKAERRGGGTAARWSAPSAAGRADSSEPEALPAGAPECDPEPGPFVDPAPYMDRFADKGAKRSDAGKPN